MCEGLPPFDFTQALRNTPLTMTVGQLMSLEKLPRAAITKAFRSPRKAKQGKQQAAYLAEEVTPTASVCQATIANVPISLILDSGSSLNIVSQPLFQKLGLQVTRRATKPITGIHGTKRLPAGEYDNLPITIRPLTIPADVSVIDTNAYSVVLGNEWLSKTQANIDWKTMIATLTWDKQQVRVPFCC